MAPSDWSGSLKGKRLSSAELTLTATLQQSTDGGSGAFQGLADDQRRYWIKPLNNYQGAQVPITEQIIGRVGTLIGAPTCEVRTIFIPETFAGWSFRPGRTLEVGIAHASLDVADVMLARALDRRADDDNARRQAAIFALYDWCWGGDVQGLYAVREENRFYSHDHGWYLPPTGANWTLEELTKRVDEPHELPHDTAGISGDAVDKVASSLEALRRNDLRDALASTPLDWPVTDTELESVGHFLEQRACAVAQRLRLRFGRSQ